MKWLSDVGPGKLEHRPARYGKRHLHSQAHQLRHPAGTGGLCTAADQCNLRPTGTAWRSCHRSRGVSHLHVHPYAKRSFICYGKTLSSGCKSYMKRNQSTISLNSNKKKSPSDPTPGSDSSTSKSRSLPGRRSERQRKQNPSDRRKHVVSSRTYCLYLERR